MQELQGKQQQSLQYADRRAHEILMGPTFAQRESSATIKAAPVKYEQNSPAKAKNLIEIDCRGLEFTDFKPDVCRGLTRHFRVLTIARGNGRPQALTQGQSSPALICLKASGSTMTKRQVKRSALKTLDGRFGELRYVDVCACWGRQSRSDWTPQG
jgi:hypothetical protein